MCLPNLFLLLVDSLGFLTGDLAERFLPGLEFRDPLSFIFWNLDRLWLGFRNWSTGSDLVELSLELLNASRPA